MQIQSTQPKVPHAFTPVTAEKPSESIKEQWTSVTFNEETDTFSFQKPGHHLGKSLMNPLESGLKSAALVGVPALVGAATSALVGTGGSALVNIALSPLAGGVVTGLIAGRSVYKESRGNPLYTGLAGVAAGAAGAVAYPLLKMPGTFGGFTGAAVTAGVVGAGVAIWAAVNNSKIREEAMQAGWTPKQN